MLRYLAAAVTVAALSLLGGCAVEEPSDDPVVVVAFDDADDDDGAPNNVGQQPEDPDDEPEQEPEPEDEPVPAPDDEPVPSTDPNAGWIGGACDTPTDCDFDNSVCLADGRPGGECTQSCDGLCPDRDGENSLTFCMSDGDAGRCVSQCDTELYGFRGCREGYECQSRSRFGDRETTNPVCVPRGTPPEKAPEPLPCLEQLTALGVDYRAWSYTTQYADGLACTIDDPIYVSSPINGIDYRYRSQSAPGEMAMACELALALHELGELFAQHDIVEVEHYGTFNCRKIGGTDSLSMHALGLAIDFYGFEDSAGQDYVFVRDWEHDTSNPTSVKGRFLHTLANDMWSEGLFNIILTPNFPNHDDHIHADLTPGGQYFASYASPYELGTDCGN